MRNIIRGTVIFAGALWLTAAQVSASPIRPVAIVNDQVISSADVENRAQLLLITTGLPDTPEVRQKMMSQVLHMLVDETLQMQEGAKNGITISENELKEAEASIERKNGWPPGSMDQSLEQAGIPKLSFYAQLRAQLTWAKLIGKKIRGRVQVSDKEIERASKKAAADPQGSEIQISVIRLPVDSAQAEPGVKALADKLAGEIKGGASFEKVARQFESGGSGQAISEMWVDESQMDPLIVHPLKSMPDGGITDPIKTQNGYQIVKVHARRMQGEAPKSAGPDAELAIRQITLTLKPDAKPQEAGLMLTVAKEVSEHAGTCLDKNIAGVENIADMDIKVTYVRQLISSLAPELRAVIENIPVGGISEPYASPEGIQLYMVCERTVLPAADISDNADKERIRRQLLSDKLELEAQKYMRNLRRDAFIDVR